MAAQRPPSMDLFESYFKRADLDHDGKISGSEAVTFLQASNLPKQVLAQIWTYANQNQTSFLGRQEFYNALRLVTVAQSGRGLTPDIVKAALGPAAAQIPPPQINLSALPPTQINTTSPQIPPAQSNASGPNTFQNLGVRGQQALPNMGTNRPVFPSPNNNMTRPLQQRMPPASIPMQGGQVGAALQSPTVRAAQAGPTPGATAGPQTPIISSHQSTSMDLVLSSPKPSGNGVSSGSALEADIFSGFQQPSLKSDPLQTTVTSHQSGNRLQSPLHVKQNQSTNVQSTSALTAASASSDIQSWPPITHSNIQKYTKVFIEVDKDRDGKITGAEARNLFLSWNLPREVLKQVWDLSDQDNDSMLSLKEFCTALYLMERHREGRQLPAVLPNNLRFNDNMFPSPGLPSSGQGGSAWQRNPGLPPQGVSRQGVPGPRPGMHHNVMKPPRAPLPSLPEEPLLPQQQMAKVPVLEKHLVDQLSEDEQKSINTRFQEASDADKKVKELEKEILEAKEKTDYFRAKMQELVLYKSRCDNRLNEITERISADKREAESLAKKYEDKYKKIGGDIASKLSLDEATFRDIQERKLELYNAIVKLEQGGTDKGVLKDKVDRIQSDLEELVKTLNERCKQYGLRAKPASLVELPFGWQPGIQEGAADWDEDWDKFNDEGYTIVKELTIEVENIIAKPKSPAADRDKSVKSSVEENKSGSVRDEVSTAPSSSNEEDSKTETEKPSGKTSSPEENNKIETEKPSGNGGHLQEDESSYAHSDDGSAKSPHASPKTTALHGLSPKFQPKQVSYDNLSPRAKEFQSDHFDAESTISGDRFFDEPSWGAKFDSDETDSMWGGGLSTINTKASDHDREQHDSFFGPGDFNLNPIRTESPSAESVYGAYNNKAPSFDSVPSTPLYNSSFSPRFSDGFEDNNLFDNRFSRFDSFNMSDGGLFTPRDNTFSRFDSMRSSAADPPSLARFDSMRSTTSEMPSFGNFARFDSMRSTSDFGAGFPSFDDDPFGSSEPFKSSTTDGQTPKKNNDAWSAF